MPDDILVQCNITKEILSVGSPRDMVCGFLCDCPGLWAFVIAFGLLPVLATAAQNGSPGYTRDNSDWWSFTRTPDLDDKILVQKREPSSSNFQILGLELNDDVFDKAAAKLGKAPIVERGDGAAGRSQVCYVSLGEQGRIHLVFEKGEVNEVFYLFEGGPDWQGSNLCFKSTLITRNLSVASGLSLGKTPAEIRGILGEPSAVAADKVSYFFSVEKKTPASHFENLKQRYPELSEEELHRNYDSYTLGVYIEARFSSGKLNYLAVSKTEAY